MMSKKYKSFNIQSNVEVYEWGGNMSIDIDNPCQGSDSFELTKQQAMDFFGLVEPKKFSNTEKVNIMFSYMGKMKITESYKVDDDELSGVCDDFLERVGK